MSEKWVLREWKALRVWHGGHSNVSDCSPRWSYRGPRMLRSPAAPYLNEKTIGLLGLRHPILSLRLLCFLRSREINTLPQDPADSWLSRPDFGSVGFLASKLSRDRKLWKRPVLSEHLRWEQGEGKPLHR